MVEYNLRIDFLQDSSRPSRVFSSMGNLIEAFDHFDHAFLTSLGCDASSELLFHDIEKGSLKAVLRWVLKLPDKEALREGNWSKVLGRLIDYGRDYFLDFLEENPEISEVKQLEDVQNGLLKLASTSEAPYLLNAPSPIPLPKILNNIKKIESSTKSLVEEDKVDYESKYRKRKITKTITIREEVEEELLSKIPIQHPTKAILVVKKPDLIGDSQWDLLLAGKVIHAKILDEEWLQRFHSRDIDLKSGDAIEVILEITMLEDYTGKLVGYRHCVNEVRRVIPRDKLRQLELDEQN